MKKNFTQQEVLLITGTNFSSRQWCEKDVNPNHFTENEKLEDACWNGILWETLPEIFGEHVNAKMLSLWQIRRAASGLQLELGEFPSTMEKHFSIDPYSFLETQSYN